MISFPESCSVLVTGASSGIGRACALLLNNLGATVIACGRDEERLAAARAAAAAPDRWHNEPRDLLHDMEHLPDWITDLRGRYGKLWGLLHAAGEGRMDSLRQYDLAEARRHFDINFHVPLLLAKGFADRRNYQRGGAMLFLSSAAAVHPEKGHCLYGAGKAALAAAMQAVSQEVAPAGLRVHCLAPGLVRTPMLDTSVQHLGESYLSAQEAAYPLGLGRPEDVAFMAAFLLSDKAAWISGQNFVLAGGRY